MREIMQAPEFGEMVVLAGDGQITLVGVAPGNWSTGPLSIDEVRVLNLGPGEALVHSIGFRLANGPASTCERAWRVPPGGERVVMSRDLYAMCSLRLAESDPGAADAFGHPSGRPVEMVVQAFTAAGSREAVWPCRLETIDDDLVFTGEPA